MSQILGILEKVQRSFSSTVHPSTHIWFFLVYLQNVSGIFKKISSNYSKIFFKFFTLLQILSAGFINFFLNNIFSKFSWNYWKFFSSFPRIILNFQTFPSITMKFFQKLPYMPKSWDFACWTTHSIYDHAQHYHFSSIVLYFCSKVHIVRIRNNILTSTCY